MHAAKGRLLFLKCHDKLKDIIALFHHFHELAAVLIRIIGICIQFPAF